MIRPLADKDAMFGLSYCLAVIEHLQKREPVKHSRRTRKLSDVHTRLMELMDLYPGDVPADMVERAAQVFDVMDEKLKEGEGK